MRAVVQRVRSASVSIAGEITAQIGPGLLVLLGVAGGDQPADAAWLAQKIAALRIFEDETGRMNRSLLDGSSAIAAGERPDVDPPARSALVVSQFTLLARTRKGTLPSFNDAAAPEIAVPLYQGFVDQLILALGPRVRTGTFGARMDIALVNDGPVTLILDTTARD